MEVGQEVVTDPLQEDKSQPIRADRRRRRRVSVSMAAQPNQVTYQLLFTLVTSGLVRTTERRPNPHRGRRHGDGGVTSTMTSARPGLHSNSQRRGVMPLVLFWNFSGVSWWKSLNLQGGEGQSHTPASEGRLHPSEWRRHLHAPLHDVRVDLSHAVDGVRPKHTQVGHVDPLGLTLLDERHAPQTVGVPGELRRHLLPDGGEAPSKRTLKPTPIPELTGHTHTHESRLTSRCLWLIS